MIEVTAINRDRSMAVMEDGQTIAITDWLDADGENCGPLPSGQWVAIDLSAFAETKLH